jgi:hypothetical protein
MYKSPHHFYSTGGREIGRGQYGKVFESFQTIPGTGTKPKKVALKEQDDFPNSRLEAEIMASLPGHENVCEFFDTRN